MDELRDKVAAEIHWVGRFMEGDKYAIADRILALAEIAEARDALAERRLNAMSPGAFGSMLLDNLPPKG